MLGKDIIILVSGNFLTFIETSKPEKNELIYNANSEARGDGIECFASHKTLNCFAFAEKAKNPRILILSYPNFEIFRKFDSL